MSKLQTAQRFYTLSILALIEANTGNPFIDKGEAMRSLNAARTILRKTREEAATIAA